MENRTVHNTTTARLFIVLAFILCATTIVKSQNQIEIVIVASSHDNPKPAEAYKYVVDKLKNYNPDMVFGEYLSSEDLKTALEAKYWGTKRFEQKYKYLLARNPKAANNKGHNEKAYQALGKFAYYHKTRTDLARNLFFNYDLANADYQLYVLAQLMQPKFGKGEQAYFQKVFGGIDSLQKVGFLRNASEYNKIYFPLVYQLGHDRIYAADCQKYDGNWNQAWAKTDSLIKVMYATAKADTASAEAQVVKAIQDYDQRAEQKSKEIDTETYGFMSTDLYAEYNEVVNFYGGPKFYDMAGFPKEAVLEMLHWWQKRNEGICENIVRQAQEHSAKKVVMAVGAAHRKGMEEVFAKMPNVKVKNYNDLP